MEVPFKKYHGLGNDYLVIDPSLTDVKLTLALIRLICDRHFGIGADGILYGPTSTGGIPDVRIFNPDGSEAEKSGNGLRIFAKYVFENGYVREKHFTIKTLSGMVQASIQDDAANMIKINMGKVTFLSTEIPVKGQEREVVDEELQVNRTKYRVTCLSIGNPHCIVPVERASEQKARELGPSVENHDMFPNRMNMQLLKVIDRNSVDIRIWERGAGYTLASGSSACAAAAAAHRLGLVNSDVSVKMPGGSLLIEIARNQQIYMTGPVEGVFQGRFHADLAEKISRTE